MPETIDLRSDTVTRPTPAMREAIATAEVGDDVFGDDPTVNRLQELAAEITGMQAALFVPSGTQSNLVALMSHCQRGDEYIVGQTAHTYKYEAGGAAVLGSIQPQPIDFEKDGTLDLEKVRKFIKPDDSHFARTRLLCLENTTNGKVLPLEYLAKARGFVDEHGLSLHLDGARVFNAAVALGVELREITQHFDTVSVCLSKGLGAPSGSVLCGPADFIREAHKWRKMVGGGMRQAGIIAAGGIHALHHHVDRLADDHANAAALAEGLAAIDGVTVCGHATNMVFVRVAGDSAALARDLADEGIIIRPGDTMRFVTHLDVDRADIDRVVEHVAHSLTH